MGSPRLAGFSRCVGRGRPSPGCEAWAGGRGDGVRGRRSGRLTGKALLCPKMPRFVFWSTRIAVPDMNDVPISPPARLLMKAFVGIPFASYVSSLGIIHPRFILRSTCSAVPDMYGIPIIPPTILLVKTFCWVLQTLDIPKFRVIHPRFILRSTCRAVPDMNDVPISPPASLLMKAFRRIQSTRDLIVSSSSSMSRECHDQQGAECQGCYLSEHVWSPLEQVESIRIRGRNGGRATAANSSVFPGLSRLGILMSQSVAQPVATGKPRGPGDAGPNLDLSSCRVVESWCALQILHQRHRLLARPFERIDSRLVRLSDPHATDEEVQALDEEEPPDRDARAQ